MHRHRVMCIARVMARAYAQYEKNSQAALLIPYGNKTEFDILTHADDALGFVAYSHMCSERSCC